MPFPCPTLVPKPLTREQILDRFGDLNLKLEHMAPDVAEHKALKEEIVSWSKDEPALKPCVFPGARWTVQFMPRENRRTVFDRKKAFALMKKLIGLEALIALFDIPLGAGIDKYIPEEKHKEFLVKERTGPRDMRVVPTNPPPKAA